MSDFTVDTTPVSGLDDARSGNSRSTNSRTGRKTFKTDKEKEAIWPSRLERVLIEGVKRYTPPAARGTRGRLQRFPKRNKLISKYIYDVTGKSRSSKQVGSRIQQLRTTCRDPELMRCLVDLTRFEGPSDRASTRSASVSGARSQSEDPGSPTMNVGPISLPAESLDAPLSPSSTIAQPTISKSICIDMTVLDDDWHSNTRTAPSLFIDLEDPASAHNAVTDAPCTVTQAELYLAPVSTIRSFDLDKAARYRVTSTVYCNEMAVHSHSSECVTSYDCRLTTSLVPAFWSEVIGSVSHAQAFTILQSIDPMDSLASARVDLIYSVRLQYQSACVSPVSSPGASSSSYDSMPGFTDFAPYPHVDSGPADAGDYINVPSPHASFAAIPLTPSYGAPSTDSYHDDSWSYTEPLQLHLQPSYHNHYTL